MSSWGLPGVVGATHPSDDGDSPKNKGTEEGPDYTGCFVFVVIICGLVVANWEWIKSFF